MGKFWEIATDASYRSTVVSLFKDCCGFFANCVSYAPSNISQNTYTTSYITYNYIDLAHSILIDSQPCRITYNTL